MRFLAAVLVLSCSGLAEANPKQVFAPPRQETPRMAPRAPAPAPAPAAPRQATTSSTAPGAGKFKQPPDPRAVTVTPPTPMWGSNCDLGKNGFGRGVDTGPCLTNGAGFGNSRSGAEIAIYYPNGQHEVLIVDGPLVFAPIADFEWDGQPLAPGRHFLSFRSPGHKPMDVVFEAADPAAEGVAKGFLQLRLEPEDAVVYLDGKRLGTASDLARLDGAIPLQTDGPTLAAYTLKPR